MTPKELKDRTKRFAVNVILFVRELPATIDGREVGRQLLRAGTSVASNYRATCRSRSRAEFIAKLGTVLEESDEALLARADCGFENEIAGACWRADKRSRSIDSDLHRFTEDGKAGAVTLIFQSI